MVTSRRTHLRFFARDQNEALQEFNECDFHLEESESNPDATTRSDPERQVRVRIARLLCFLREP